MNKKRIERSISWQSVFVVVPILSIWAACRIKKLRKFLLLYLILVGINLLAAFLIPFPHSMPVFLAIYISVMISYMRTWSRLWNEDIYELYTD